MVCGLHVRIRKTSTIFGFEGGGKSKSSSSSSPLTPPVVTTMATPPPSQLWLLVLKLSSLVQSFLTDFFSQSGQIGTNPLISAPPAVPNSVSLLCEAAGGLSAVTPSEALLTESPGEVLPMTQVGLPPPIISVKDVSLVRGVVSSGGSPYPGHGHNVRHGMTDQLRVGGVSYEPSLPPLSALSPISFLFPSSDSGFVSVLFFCFSCFSPSCWYLLFYFFLLVYFLFYSSYLFGLYFLFASYSSLLSSSSFCPLSCCGGFGPPPPPCFPPLPPGFPPLSSSSSLVSSSFSTPLSLSSSSLYSASLTSFVSSSSSAPASASVSSAPFGSSSLSSSSSSLDYASYKAHVLGISDEYLSLARWCISVDGSDFFSFLSRHCPHLSSDVAKDFSSGSSILPSTLRSSSALVSGPPASTPVALPSSSLFSSAVSSSSGGVSSGISWGSVAAPISSTGFLSSFPSGSAFLSGPPPLLAQSLPSSSLLPPSLSLAGGPLGSAAVADPVPSAARAYAQARSSPLFRPFDAPSAGPSGVVSPPALPLHGSSPVFGSAPLSGVPPHPAAPLGSSFSLAAPGPSFAPSLPDDSAFDPDFADPSAMGPEPPLAPTVPDSVRAEIRRMYCS